MGKDYTSYLLNKVNQYKDSNALRFSSLGLAQLNWKGMSGFSPGYYISNMSLTNLIIEEIIATWTVSDSAFELRKELVGGVTLSSSYIPNSPAIWNDSNFTGSLEDRTIFAGSPLNTWYLEWLHGGSSSPYGTTMTVKFTNGTQIWAEAPGIFNIAGISTSGGYRYWNNNFEFSTPRYIKRIDLVWPVSNGSLLEINIQGNNLMWSGNDSSYSISITDFIGTEEDRTFVPQLSDQRIDFLFSGTAVSTPGYTFEIWLENGEYDIYDV